MLAHAAVLVALVSCCAAQATLGLKGDDIVVNTPDARGSVVLDGLDLKVMEGLVGTLSTRVGGLEASAAATQESIQRSQARGASS